MELLLLLVVLALVLLYDFFVLVFMENNKSKNLLEVFELGTVPQLGTKSKKNFGQKKFMSPHQGNAASPSTLPIPSMGTGGGDILLPFFLAILSSLR